MSMSPSRSAMSSRASMESAAISPSCSSAWMSTGGGASVSAWLTPRSSCVLGLCEVTLPLPLFSRLLLGLVPYDLGPGFGRHLFLDRGLLGPAPQAAPGPGAAGLGAG